MAPEAVFARLKLASDLADLRPEHRLDAKLDMSPRGVMRRLQIASELRDLCNALARAGRGEGGASGGDRAQRDDARRGE
jgi:hypothetical protein